MGLIRSALCSPDLGECFTYPEHAYNSYKIFLEALKVKNSQKSVEYSRNSHLDLSFIHVTFWPNWKNVFLLR